MAPIIESEDSNTVSAQGSCNIDEKPVDLYLVVCEAVEHKSRVPGSSGCYVDMGR
ncbi:MAG: hypothetical protein QW348_05005 [Ignisphaera sp.]